MSCRTRSTSRSRNAGFIATSATSATSSGANSDSTVPPTTVSSGVTLVSIAPPHRAVAAAISAALRVVVPSVRSAARKLESPVFCAGSSPVPARNTSATVALGAGPSRRGVTASPFSSVNACVSGRRKSGGGRGGGGASWARRRRGSARGRARAPRRGGSWLSPLVLRLPEEHGPVRPPEELARGGVHETGVTRSKPSSIRFTREGRRRRSASAASRSAGRSRRSSPSRRTARAAFTFARASALRVDRPLEVRRERLVRSAYEARPRSGPCRGTGRRCGASGPRSSRGSRAGSGRPTPLR